MPDDIYDMINKLMINLKDLQLWKHNMTKTHYIIVSQDLFMWKFKIADVCWQLKSINNFQSEDNFI